MPWILKPQSDPDLKPQKWGKNRHGFIIEEKKMQISVKRTDLEPNQYARIDRWIATKIEPLKPRNWGKVTIFTDSIGTYTERQQIKSNQTLFLWWMRCKKFPHFSKLGERGFWVVFSRLLMCLLFLVLRKTREPTNEKTQPHLEYGTISLFGFFVRLPLRLWIPLLVVG